MSMHSLCTTVAAISKGSGRLTEQTCQTTGHCIQKCWGRRSAEQGLRCTWMAELVSSCCLQRYAQGGYRGWAWWKVSVHRIPSVTKRIKVRAKSSNPRSGIGVSLPTNQVVRTLTGHEYWTVHIKVMHKSPFSSSQQPTWQQRWRQQQPNVHRRALKLGGLGMACPKIHSQ